jgi:hypothetical protein
VQQDVHKMNMTICNRRAEGNIYVYNVCTIFMSALTIDAVVDTSWAAPLICIVCNVAAAREPTKSQCRPQSVMV